jgi:predicted metal-dependent hydrolase
MRRDARQHSFAASEPLGSPVTPDVLKGEIRIWAERLDVAPSEIRLTGMSRKWASCSTRGRVTFATDLLAQPEPFRREVIVHELLHLKVPNHGPLFRALLSAHLSSSDSADDEPAGRTPHRGQMR